MPSIFSVSMFNITQKLGFPSFSSHASHIPEPAPRGTLTRHKTLPKQTEIGWYSFACIAYGQQSPNDCLEPRTRWHVTLQVTACFGLRSRSRQQVYPMSITWSSCIIFTGSIDVTLHVITQFLHIITQRPAAFHWEHSGDCFVVLSCELVSSDDIITCLFR